MQLFYLINGWAGRNELVDAALRFFYVCAVPLLATLLAVALLLLPRSAGSPIEHAPPRQRIALASLLALACCFLTVPMVDAFSTRYLQTPILSPRPFVTHFVNALVVEPNDNSFPCPEVIVATALAILLTALWPAAGWIACGLALLLGIARIYCGTNYPIDVFVGGAIGAAWSLLALALCRVPLRLKAHYSGHWDSSFFGWRARHQALLACSTLLLVVAGTWFSLANNPRYSARLNALWQSPASITATSSAQAAPMEMTSAPARTFNSTALTADLHEGEGTEGAPGLHSEGQPDWIQPSSPLDPARRHGRQPEAEAHLKTTLEKLALPHRILDVQVAQIFAGTSSYRGALVRFEVHQRGSVERRRVVETAAQIAKRCFHADGQLQNVDVVGVVLNANRASGTERSMFTMGAVPVFTASVLRSNLKIINGPQWVNAPNVDGGSWLRARSLLYINTQHLPVAAPTPIATPTTTLVPTPIPKATPTAIPTASAKPKTTILAPKIVAPKIVAPKIAAPKIVAPKTVAPVQKKEIPKPAKKAVPAPGARRATPSWRPRRKRVIRKRVRRQRSNYRRSYRNRYRR